MLVLQSHVQKDMLHSFDLTVFFHPGLTVVGRDVWSADTSVGTKTCHHGWSPGSFGYYKQDAVRSCPSPRDTLSASPRDCFPRK